MGSARHTDAQGLIDVIPGRRAGLIQLLFYVFQVFHFEADVVDATVILTVLRSSHLVVLEVQDRQVDVAVTEIIPLGIGAVELGNLLKTEHIDIELGCLVGILGGDGYMLNLRHDSPLISLKIGQRQS